MSLEEFHAGGMSAAVYLPEFRILTNKDLEGFRIESKTAGRYLMEADFEQKLGVLERAWAAPDQTVADLGVESLKAALQGRKDVSFVFGSNSHPDGDSLSLEVGQRAGLTDFEHLNVYAACSGSAVCFAYIKAHESEFVGRVAAMTASEIYSPTLIDLSTKQGQIEDENALSQTIFTDISASTVFTYGQDLTVIDTIDFKLPEEFDDSITMATDESKMVEPFIFVHVPRSPDNKFHMNGKKVYEGLMDRGFGLPALNRNLVERNNLKPEQVVIVPHQASLPIIRGLRKFMPGYRIFEGLAKGNGSSASNLKALMEARRSGMIGPNDFVLISGFGASLYASSSLIQLAS